MTESAQRHAFTALAAAALFGASVPLSKLLLGDLGPLALAGLLYLGSGAGLALVWVARASMNGVTGTESGISRLTTADLPSLAGSILCGGILAPVMLLWGLSGLDAASTSLLLNAESVLTMLLAAVVFAEHVSGRLWLASLVMLVAGAVLAWQPAASLPVSLHALAVLAACLMWGMDNNLTRRIAGGDALTIAMVKGLAAGCVNLALAWFVSEGLPAGAHVGAAMLLGAASFGVSLVLYVVALRHLGSARTGAHFATAPFFGAALAVALGAPLTLQFVAALALMIVASVLVLTERHGHRHSHEPMRHSHSHVHDEHHRHAHAGEPGGEPHVHEHEHQPMTHAHVHLPDLHHRHGH